VLSRTGLRLGEALALRWEDLDLIAREMRVERALGPAGEVDTLKSGHGRTVDLGTSACELLRRLLAAEARDALERGRSCPWIFPSRRLRAARSVLASY